MKSKGGEKGKSDGGKRKVGDWDVGELRIENSCVCYLETKCC